MKHPLSVLFILLLYNAFGQQKIVTDDIDRFWEAYDKISQSKDSAAQHKYLNDLYISKASPGLESLMRVRRYNAKTYVDAINNYPLFWNSIRQNTFKSKVLGKEINAGIEKLKQIYPHLKPSTIYFAIGVFRTNGTIDGDKVLIGSEMALSDKSVNTQELPEHPREFNRLYTPIDDIVLLCTHEYVHTQQKPFVDNLLSYCLYEGIAEFVSTTAIGKESNTPAVAYAKENYAKVRDKFEEDVFIPARTYNWLWSENTVFGYRDLGYAVGFQVAEKYYNRAKDKKKAVKDLVELDYSNEAQVEQLVDRSGYLSKPLSGIFDEFEKSRPFVTGVGPFENGSTHADPKTTTVTITFSQPMDANSRGFDYGPLGEDNVLSVREVIGFSDDRKSFSYKVQLEPKKRYQCLVTNNFTANGIPLKPYLIDITTE